MKNLTIGQRIIAGFTAIVVICAALGAIAVIQLRSISKLATVTTTESLEGMDCVGRIESEAQDNNLLLVKDMMTKNEDLRADLELQIQTNLDQMADLAGEYQKSKSSAAARTALDTFDNARKDYAENLNAVLKLSHAEQTLAAMELKKSKVDPFLTTIQAEAGLNKQNGQTAVQQVKTTAAKTQFSILVVFGIMLVASVAIAAGIILVTNRVLKKVSTQLNDGSGQILGAANLVASASQSLAEGSGEQAASIEETSASLEEMSSMTKRNAENARKANELAKQARGAADKGATDMQTMGNAMQAIKASSDDIAKIIKTIDEIAFQTNILALNAAVEAARAGEAGMGFAVVADEVRNLAQRSAQAAKETAGKIEGAITKTGQGVEISVKVAAVLSEIVNKVRQVDELVAEVAGASSEQTSGITQINSAVGQMDKVTQNNAASAEESAAAAEELQTQAVAMKESVAELLKLVGGTSAAPVKPVHEAKTILAANALPLVSSKPINGNGRHPTALKPAVANRRGEIPLDGDFKDF